MLRRGSLIAMCGVLALGLVGCSSSSSKKETGSSTIPRTGTTIGVAPSSTAPVSASSTVLTTSAEQATDSTGPGSASTSRTATSTTVAGRVVSKPSDNAHLGDSGPGVKQIQTALVARGYKVTTDGKFGAQTEQAIKGFQAKNGLTQDGVVGPATWAKLQAAPTVATTKPTTTTIKGTTTTKH